MHGVRGVSAWEGVSRGMSIFDFDGWTCTYQARKGHIFQRGRNRILVRRGEHPGQLIVQRDWLSRTFNLAPPYYGEPDGGLQGGSGIDLYPVKTRETQAQMDGVIRRHHIARFDEQGEPVMPWPGPRYPLAARPQGDSYQAIDGAHLIRAYSHAVALRRDPVARMWLILCAYDVLRRFPLVPFTDGDGPEYSLASMETNVWRYPHSGALGITRENAWCLRCVVEAQRVAPCSMFEEWISRFIAMMETGQARNGAVERVGPSSGLHQGEPWSMFGLTADVEVCASWQVPFAVVALDEAVKVMPNLQPKVRTILSFISPWWQTVPLVPGEDGSAHGLPRYLVVARGGVLVPTITEGVGPARGYYDYAAKAIFARYAV